MFHNVLKVNSDYKTFGLISSLVSFLSHLMMTSLLFSDGLDIYYILTDSTDSAWFSLAVWAVFGRY